MNDELKRFAADLHTDIAAGRTSPWAELYALDAVSEAERSIIDEHVSAASEDVRNEFDANVRQARETITMAYATHEEEPPTDLLARIISGLPAEDAAAPSGESRGSGADDQLARRRHRKQGRVSPARRWMIGAAAAAVLGVGSIVVAQTLPDPSLQEQVIEASDVSRATVEIPAGGTVEIQRSDSLNAAVVTLRDVSPPSTGKVYQMWRVPEDGSAPESVGVMSGEDLAGGKTTVVRGIEPFAALAITVEPEGGSATPTMPIVAQVPLDA
ncbi:anti-sigma factor [Arthrobacter castelli]|uniref:anti-sigma factor n=1 Tax=Arthrobacter castelli TaxID=271431 RepID=UPI0003FD2FAB|nr:anti-sigma factor [Arthrobacter castelli]